MMNSTIGVPLGATSSNHIQDARDVTDALGQVAFDKMYGKTTGMGITLQVLASTTGLDALGDVSNVIYDIKTGQNWKQTVWDAAMVLPVIGAFKVIDRVTDAAKAGKKIINAGDSIADATRAGGKTVEALSDVPIKKIGGRNPINSKYAGQNYTSGVKFKDTGFPDFKHYTQAEVNIKGLTGNYAKDSAIANKAMGYPSTPKGYVWHHVENGTTMQLIPRELHNNVPHTGGAAVIRHSDR